MVNAIYQKLTKDFTYVKYIMVKVHKKKKKMEQKNGWFAFWQKLMKCLSKQDETGVGDTKSVAPVNTIIQSIKGVSSSKEKDSSKVKSLTESVDTFLKSRYDFRYNVR